MTEKEWRTIVISWIICLLLLHAFSRGDLESMEKNFKAQQATINTLQDRVKQLENRLVLPVAK